MRSETKALYPADWPEIARRIREERGNRCERCGQIGNMVSDQSTGNNYLTVHHLDYNPANCDPENLVVLCQSCHLKTQMRELPGLIRRWKLEKAGQLPLLELEPIRGLPPWVSQPGVIPPVLKASAKREAKLKSPIYRNDYDGWTIQVTQDCPNCTYFKGPDLAERLGLEAQGTAVGLCVWGAVVKWLLPSEQPHRCGKLKSARPKRAIERWGEGQPELA